MESTPPASDCAADALEPEGEWNAYLQAISGFMNGAGLEHVSVADYTAYDAASTGCNWRSPAGYGTVIAASLPHPIDLAPVDSGPVHRTGRTRRGGDDPSRRRPRPGGYPYRLDRGAGREHNQATTWSGRLASRRRLPPAWTRRKALPRDRWREFVRLRDARDWESSRPPHRCLPHPSIRLARDRVLHGRRGGPDGGGDGPAAGFAHAIDQLAGLFGSSVRRNLHPLVASNWGRMTFVGGAYSHALPGHATARKDLALPFEQRVFFAGEATHTDDFSTAHGAYDSGVRAAEEAIVALPPVEPVAPDPINHDTIKETLARSTAMPRDEPKQPPLSARNKPEMSDGGDWQRVSPDVNCDVQR